MGQINWPIGSRPLHQHCLVACVGRDFLAMFIMTLISILHTDSCLDQKGRCSCGLPSTAGVTCERKALGTWDSCVA